MSRRQDLDPFRVIISAIANSDTLISVANSAGLQFDLNLNEEETYSNETRHRVYLVRILNAYRALSEDQQLAAARAALLRLHHGWPEIANQVAFRLEVIGWKIENANLVVRTSDVREVFFPKGSQWDAFVVLKEIFHRAKNTLTIVDAYCAAAVFGLLNPNGPPLKVLILCSRYAETLSAEAKTFTMQFPAVTFEIRKTKDFHDRFVVVDDIECFHIGASIKDAGNTAFMVSRLDDEENRNALLASIKRSLDVATPVP